MRTSRPDPGAFPRIGATGNVRFNRKQSVVHVVAGHTRGCTSAGLSEIIRHFLCVDNEERFEPCYQSTCLPALPALRNNLDGGYSAFSVKKIPRLRDVRPFIWTSSTYFVATSLPSARTSYQLCIDCKMVFTSSSRRMNCKGLLPSASVFPFAFPLGETHI